MSAEQNLDADAFMRKYLERPSDVTARLVFADWLEETGEDHNAAWAHFIRLKAEADRYPRDSATRHELDRHAGVYATQIRARLTIPAELFIGYPKSLLQLLPATNITVNLARFTIPREVVELMPESVARESRVLPLDVQDRVLLVAAVDPNDLDLTQRLEFILNRDIVLVTVEGEDMQDALDRHYDSTETESVTEELVHFPELEPGFVSTAPPAPPEPPPDDEQLGRLVNLILTEAVRHRADEVRFVPTPGALVVSFLVDGAWVERDNIPLRLQQAVTARIAIMAWLNIVFTQPPSAYVNRGSFRITVRGVRIHFDVAITLTAAGPATHIVLRQAPVTVEDR